MLLPICQVRSYFLPRDAMLAMLSSCVRPSFRLPHADIVLIQLNTRSRKQRHAIAQGLLVFDAKNIDEIQTRSQRRWREMEVG